MEVLISQQALCKPPESRAKKKIVSSAKSVHAKKCELLLRARAAQNILVCGAVRSADLQPPLLL